MSMKFNFFDTLEVLECYKFALVFGSPIIFTSITTYQHSKNSSRGPKNNLNLSSELLEEFTGENLLRSYLSMYSPH